VKSVLVLLNPLVQVSPVQVQPPAIPDQWELAIGDHVLESLGGSAQIDCGLRDGEKHLLNFQWPSRQIFLQTGLDLGCDLFRQKGFKSPSRLCGHYQMGLYCETKPTSVWIKLIMV
jgi:hypothetical protein